MKEARKEAGKKAGEEAGEKAMKKGKRFCVSGCLAGLPCRWDGASRPDPRIQRLVARGMCVVVCPEVQGGLLPPRKPCELCGDRVLARDGTDCTGAFRRGAAKALAMALAFGVGLFIFYVYKKTYRGVMYSSSFGVTLIALTLITTLVILAVTSNVVLSLGMVGALSIVRFRTAIKEPLDIAFLFWSIAAGIVLAAGMIPLAVIGSVELNYEVRLKDGNADFVTELAALDGVSSAVLVSYNGDYLG